MKTILIIDDEVDIQAALEFFFTRKGYQVLTASNGIEGLAILSGSRLPDLILLDGNMPLMNGKAFLQTRKDQNLHPHIPVFLLSSEFWNLEDTSILRKIPKPFDLNYLLEAMESVLKPDQFQDFSI